tara:strand:- start:1059 stop:1436 length:378 start_codon:yes stop_codon:yes gene_type:complete
MRFGKLDPTLPPKQAKVGGKATKWANVRLGATTSADIIAEAPAGQIVEVLNWKMGQDVGGDTAWFEVSNPPLWKGYMHNSVLEPIGSSGNTTNGAGSLTTTTSTPEWLLPAIVVGGLALFLMGKK